MEPSAKEKKSVHTLDESYLEAILGERMDSGRKPAAGRPGMPQGPVGAHGPLPDGREAAPADPEWDGMELRVSYNAMEVVLISHGLKTADNPVTAKRILAELDKLGIVYGVDEAAVAEIENTLIRRPEGWQGDLIIARGTPPGQTGKITYPFLNRVWNKGPGETAWLVEGTGLQSPMLKRLINTAEISELKKGAGVKVKAVQPGEVLAVVEGEMGGTDGIDVFGMPVKPDSLRVKASGNVHFNARKLQYEAMIYGFLCIEGDEFSILPPLWIAPDHMAAYYLNLPQVGIPRHPSKEDLRVILLFAGVKESFLNENTLEQIARRLQNGEETALLVKIAQGLPPQPGKDARIELFFNKGIKAGEILNNGTMDLRERNAVICAREGDLLAEKTLATRGVQGFTLFGKRIPAPDGKDLEIKFGEGVVKKEKTDKVLYLAKKDGSISFENNTLSISDLLVVDGDIDFSTGNMDVNMNLLVTGSVYPGFKVTAEKDVQINGTIEAGATVMVKGNLNVGNGILGETTRVVVFGSLQTLFIQDAEVITKGDIIIESYLYNGIVRSGGSVRVLKKLGSKGGKVVGGILCATKGIELSTIGSTTNPNTTVSLQADPEKVLQRSRLTAAIKDNAQNIAKMMRTLQLDSFDPQKIRAFVNSAPARRRALLMKILNRLSMLIKAQKTNKEEEQKLTGLINQDLANAWIRVSNEVFQGSTVQIADKQFVAQTDMGPAVFRLQDGRITY